MKIIRKTFYLLAVLDFVCIIASIFAQLRTYFMVVAVIITAYLLFAAFAMMFHDHGMKSK